MLKTNNLHPVGYEEPCFKSDIGAPSPGIAFQLPSRRRFIPNSWLLYTELNEDQTELRLHYTHSAVTITGSHLSDLQEAVEHFQLQMIRESPASSLGEKKPHVTRIEVTENASV
jgi:hypothetical protein